MTKKIFLFLPVLAAMVLSCSTKGESDLRTIAIDLKHCPQLEEFVTNERIVSLEMKEECLIGKIDKICIDSIYFYVMDKNNKAVFVFDQEGRYISKISSQGNGPAEYIELSDIAICNRQIYILSRSNKAILIYDITGEYKDKIVLNDWYHRLYVTQDLIMLYACKSNMQYYDIVSIDHQGKVINKYMPFTNNESYLFNITPFHRIDDKEYAVCFPYERRVAFLNDAECEFRYKFDFETQVKLTDEEMDRLGYETIKKEIRYKDALHQIEEIIKCSNEHFFMITTIFLEGKGLRKVLCQTNCETEQSKTYIIGEEINQQYPYFCDPVLLQDSKIYCIINRPISTNAEDGNPEIGIYDIVVREL